MDKRGKIALKYLLGIFVILSVLLVSFVLANHVVSISGDGTSIGVNATVPFTYNIIINNNDTGQPANITQVSITLPASFVFAANTNWSNASAFFANTTNVLNWTNTSGYVINGSETKNFRFNATANTPGIYNITVTTLNATNVLQTNISVTVNDTTKPSSVDFVSPTPVPYSNKSATNITVNISAVDNVDIDTIIINLYNSTNDLINTSSGLDIYLLYNFMGLPNGLYYINATVNDTNNNINYSLTRIITLDTVPPILGIAYPANGQGYNTNVSAINYTTNANGYCWYSNSSGAGNSSTVAAGTNFTYVISNEGLNLWTVYCNDSAGNQNSTYAAFTKDTVNPGITIISPTQTNYSTHVINFNISSNENLSACNVTINGGATNNTMLLNGSLTGAGYVNSSVPDAIYTARFWCWDSLGNLNSSQTVVFRVDTTAPTISINSPTNNKKVNSRIISINYTVSDGSLNYTNVSIRNLAGEVVNSTINYTSGEAIVSLSVPNTEGVYSVYATAFDVVGYNSNDSKNIILDTTAPQVTINLPQVQNYTQLSVNITLNETGSCLYGISNESDATNATMQNNNGVDFNHTNASIEDGTYTLTAYCNDTAGNNNYSQTKRFTIDKTNPLITNETGTSVSYVNVSQTYIFVNVSVTEANEANITFRLYNTAGLVNQSSFTDKRRSINWTGLGDGIYSYNVTVVDATNHRNTTTTRVIALDLNAPVITVYSPINNSVLYGNQSITLYFSASDSAVKSLWYNYNGTNFTTTSGTATFSYNATEIRNIMVSANDSQGNITTRWIVVNITSLPANTTLATTQTNITADANTSIALTFNASLQNVSIPQSLENNSISFDLSQLLNSGSVSLGTNNFNLVRIGTVYSYTAYIPAGTTISGGSSWDGKISLPIINSTTFTSPTISGATTSVNKVISLGSGIELNFSTPVKIVIGGLAGKKAGWARGSTTLTNIATYCDNKTNPTLNSSVRECYTNDSSNTDLIIWTLHFTDFAAYTSTANAGEEEGSSGGGGALTTSFWKKTIVITDDAFKQGTTSKLARTHRARVKIGANYHYVGITSLTTNTATINISSIPQTATLSVGQERKFDVTGDNTYDVSVTLSNISGNYANLAIKSISEAITPQTTQEEVKKEETAQTIAQGEPQPTETPPITEEEEGGSLLWIWVVLIIVVIALLLGIGIRAAKNRKKGKYYTFNYYP